MNNINNQGSTGGFRGPSPKVDVSDRNIKCSKCGEQIKELPESLASNLDPNRPVYCPKCYRPRRRFRRRFKGGFPS